MSEPIGFILSFFFFFAPSSRRPVTSSLGRQADPCVDAHLPLFPPSPPLPTPLLIEFGMRGWIGGGGVTGVRGMKDGRWKGAEMRDSHEKKNR